MGYQLYWVRLCGVVAGGFAGVRPNAQSADMPAASFDILAAVAARSAVNNGTVPLHVVQLLLGAVPAPYAVQAGATPSIWAVVGQVPVALRSAGSCSNRIAFGLIGLVPEGRSAESSPAQIPVPAIHWLPGAKHPNASLYSTRK